MKDLFSALGWFEWMHTYLVLVWIGAFTRLFGVNVVFYAAVIMSLLDLTLIARFDDGFYKEEHYDCIEHPVTAIIESGIYAVIKLFGTALIMFLGASITGAIMTF